MKYKRARLCCEAEGERERKKGDEKFTTLALWMMVAASEVRRAVGTFTAGRNEKVNIYIAPTRGEAGERNVLRAERLVINCAKKTRAEKRER